MPRVYTRTQTATLYGKTCDIRTVKMDRIVFFRMTCGDGTAFSSATGADIVSGLTLTGTLLPYQDSYIVGLARTSGTWASATYVPVIILIDSANGTISIRGNANSLKGCNYLTASGMYVTE